MTAAMLDTDWELTIPTPCPTEGGGVNIWCWHAAKWLFEQGIERKSAYEIIAKASSRQDATIRDKEVNRAIERAWEGVEAQSEGDREYFRADPDLVRAIDVLASKIKPRLVEAETRDCMPELENIAVGMDASSLEVYDKHASYDPRNYQYICPNPLDDPAAGRTRENIAEVNYGVVEFDNAPSLDWQFMAHYVMSTFYPLELMVYSGNKSVHGWYAGRPSQELKYMAGLLGADMKVLNSPEQWVRMPNGTNTKTGKKQTAYWPEVAD